MNLQPRSNRERASGLIAYHFGFAAVEMESAEVQATRYVAGTDATVGVKMPYSGSIVGIGFEATDDKTAGSATFTPYLSNVQQTLGLDWPDAASGDVTTFTPGTLPFTVNDSLDIRITTSSDFTPDASLAVDCIVYVTFEPRGPYG